jgi:hypothetical protein
MARKVRISPFVPGEILRFVGGIFLLVAGPLVVFLLLATVSHGVAIERHLVLSVFAAGLPVATGFWYLRLIMRRHDARVARRCGSLRGSRSFLSVLF